METGQVVAGTDGSEDSLRAVAWAARDAALRNARLLILAVLPPPPPLTPRRLASDITGSARKGFQQALVDAVDRARAHASILADAELVPGQPTEVLTRRASHASALVVGSRGAGGFSSMFLGSVSRTVASHATCPVVIIREESVAVHREIVVGIRDPDLPGPSGALRFALEEAALRNARLLVVHAWYWSAPASRLDPPRVPVDATRHLADALARFQDAHPQVDVTVDVVHAHPGRVLAGASARADLVVVGRHDLTQAGAGAITYAVLNHAHGPVAIIPET